jgi:trk system potassium uptake protein TrkH
METLGDRVYHSVFLSVSSFCNAGFVTTDGSLTGLRTHWVPHLVVVPLLLVGSIGFPVLDNMWRVAVARVRGIRVEAGSLIRLTLHTKIVLVSSVVLYVIGFVMIFLGELIQTNQPLGPELLDAHFMNMNRTSGFNTIDTSLMGTLAQLALIFLMFVGGAPGSVAGGIKVVVFSVLVMAVWSVLRGREETTVFGRAIGHDVLRKCVAVIVLFLIGILAVTALLVVSETEAIAPAVGTSGTLLPILFEVVSAYGTCGLSMGITGDLTPIGRVAITVSMFIGRVGFLALLASLVAVTLGNRPRVGYPHEPVTVY